MDMERKCLQCHYAAKAPTNPLAIAISSWYCLRHPPSTQMIQTPQGAGVVSIYPQINAESISCAEWAEQGVV